jgi:superfamily II DNA or RNA helicase
MTAQLSFLTNKPKAELRDYQKEFQSRLFDSLKVNNRVMAQLPTGAGKTVCFGDIVRRANNMGKKTLTMAHREELVTQPQERFLEQFGIVTGRIQSGFKADLSLPHQVASVLSFNPKCGFVPDIIIADEAHHTLSVSQSKIIKAFPSAKVIGFTATPCRLSGAGFTELFEDIVIGPSVQDLEEKGHLVPARIFPTKISTAELMLVRSISGDYNEKQLSEVMIDTQKIMSIVDTYIERCNGTQALLYAASVEHSEKIVEAFKFRGIKAVHIDADSKNRKDIFKDFEAKKFQVLCNVGIATEGNDIKGLETIILARPTKSLSLFLQMVGRGARPALGKAFYYLLDHANNVFEHGLPNKFHDWKEHFIGKSKREKKAKKYPQEKQFKIKFDSGLEMISSLEKLPPNFKGVILKELDESEYFQSELFEEFETLWNVCQLMGRKPFWCFYEIAKFCNKNRVAFPSDQMLGRMAQTVGYGQGFVIKTFSEIIRKYNIN